uniref:Uncharacterized protein n=1 Tax=Oryza sativa subsp. japonica TaxID=39947 RepID=Q2QVS7_ORYSJ|nr:hypothetical protein LOC_Os12g11790 [Oryza sativa Japonica Group]
MAEGGGSDAGSSASRERGQRRRRRARGWAADSASQLRPSGGDCDGSCGRGARGRAADGGVATTAERRRLRWRLQARCTGAGSGQRRRGDSWAQGHMAAWGRTVGGGAQGCADGRRCRRGGGLAERRKHDFSL